MAIGTARGPRPGLTLRGRIVLGAALVGVVLAYVSGWSALLAVALFFAGAVLAGLAQVLLAPVRVEAERRVDPAIVEIGEAALVRLTVRTTGPAGAAWTDPVDGADAPGARGRLPGGGTALLKYEARGSVRGAATLGPLLVSRTDALGLVERRGAVGEAGRVIVLPRRRLVPLPSVATSSDTDPGASNPFGAPGDVRDVVARPYRPGDPERRVDWRATARRGELMVRAEGGAVALATCLVLDVRDDSWPSADDFEAGVEYAASLVAQVAERQEPVLVQAGGADVARGPVDAMVALALAQREFGGPGADRRAATALAEGAEVVHVVTGTRSPRVLEHLPRLPHGSAGLVTVVGRAATPPARFGWRVRMLDPELLRGGDG